MGDITGSAVYGTVDGLSKGRGVGTWNPTITYVVGTPNTVLVATNGSDIAIDSVNGVIYLSQLINGSTWSNLGSTT